MRSIERQTCIIIKYTEPNFKYIKQDAGISCVAKEKLVAEESDWVRCQAPLASNIDYKSVDQTSSCQSKQMASRFKQLGSWTVRHTQIWVEAS